MHGIEHAEFGRLRPASGPDPRRQGSQTISREKARKPERDREAFERILSSGPLFKPERLPNTRKHSRLCNTSTAQSTPDHEQPAQTQPQPGWIYVVSSEGVDGVLRLAATERAQPERRDIDAIAVFENDLGLHHGETLRYCAFTSNAYLALSHARTALSPYEVSELRYECPSAVAATAIETSRAPIHMRRTNFESDVVFDGNVENEAGASRNSARHDPSNIDELATRKQNREARREDLIDFLSSAQSCLHQASDALGDSQQTREAITGTLFADVAGLTPAMNLQRWQTAGRSEDNQRTKDAKRPRPSPRTLKKMEHWVMRREALQFLKSRNIELATGLGIAVVAGALLTTVGVQFAFNAFMSAQPDTSVFLMAGVTGAVVLGGIRAALFWRRHKRAISVWKEVLQVPVPTTR